MKHLYRAFFGALLVIALAGIDQAFARGYHWDPSCNCRRPDHQYTTKRYVREAPRVITHKRVVNRTRVVRGRTRLVQENRVIVHVRPVIKRLVVIHRTNTIVKDVVLHRVKTIHRVRNEYFHEVVHRHVRGSVRHVVVYRNVSCGCGHRSQMVAYHD
jgi:hypothetical protein